MDGRDWGTAVRIRFHWGAGVALLYAAFATATLGFVAFAIAHPAALVSNDYYREATRHDRRIEATVNGRVAAAAVTIETDASGAPVAAVRIAPEHHGRAAGTVTWYRPSDASFDRTVPLALDAAGTQRITIGDLPAGHWRVKVEWEFDGRPFYLERSVMVRR